MSRKVGEIFEQRRDNKIVRTTEKYSGSDSENDNSSADQPKTHYSSYFVTVNTNKALSIGQGQDAFVTAVDEAFDQVSVNIESSMILCPLADGRVDSSLNNDIDYLLGCEHPPEGYIREVDRDWQWERGPNKGRAHLHGILKYTHKGYVRVLSELFKENLIREIEARAPQFAGNNLYVNIKYIPSPQNASDYIHKTFHGTYKRSYPIAGAAFSHDDAIEEADANAGGAIILHTQNIPTGGLGQILMNIPNTPYIPNQGLDKIYDTMPPITKPEPIQGGFAEDLEFLKRYVRYYETKGAKKRIKRERTKKKY